MEMALSILIRKQSKDFGRKEFFKKEMIIEIEIYCLKLDKLSFLFG
jgi:hypothetical protein